MDKLGLFIGINEYPGAPLRSCVNDATNIANVLRTHENGSPNFQVMESVDQSKMTQSKLMGQIVNLFSKECQVALLYFSGHGYIDEMGGYLVTTDYQAHNKGISMDEILTLANNSNARDKVIILDCCHAGKFGNANLHGGNVSSLGSGVTVLTASRDSEQAAEKSGGGVFTSLVIEALKGGAADLRGHVTPGSLYAYVDLALGLWEQRPVFKTSVSKFTSLRQVKPPIDQDVLRRITEYFKTPDDEHKLNKTYEETCKDVAIEANVKIMKELQKMVSVGLVVPVGEEHMYFAAINGKSCKLTAIGRQYWELVRQGKVQVMQLTPEQY